MSTRRSTVKVDILGDATQLERAFKRAQAASDTFGKNVSKDADLLQKWGKRGIQAVAGIAAAVAGLVLHGGISRALNIEDAQAKLRGLGHDAESVTTIMESALNAVRGTAYGLDAAATTAATAVAAGIEPGQELERYLRLTADAATIAGVSMSEMGAILNKNTTSGRVFTQELNQLADRGLPVFTWLAEAYDVSATELRKMVSAGEIDARRFNDILEENLGGAALRSGETTRGAFANMRAAMSRLGEVFAGDFLPVARDTFNAVRDGFDEITNRVKPLMAEFHDSGGTDAFAAWLERLPRLMGDAAEGVIRLWQETETLRTTLGYAVQGVGEIVSWVLEFNRVLGGAPAIIGAVALALKALYAHPLIAGIGLVVTAIGAVTQGARDAKKAAEEWAVAMDAGTDEMADHARELALELMSNAGIRGAMDQLGISATDLTAALAGNGDEIARINDLNVLHGRGSSVAAKWVQTLTSEVNRNAEALGVAISTADDRAEALRQMRRAEEQAVTQTASFRSALGELTAAQLGNRTATDEATDAIEEQQATLRELTDPVFAAMQAVGRLEDAQRALAAAQGDASTSADDLEDAQLAVVEAFIGVQSAAGNLTAANIDAFARVAAEALGITESEARELIRSLDALDGRTVNMDIVARWRQSGAPPPGVTETGSISFRAGGGGVAAGTTYQVGEGNRPELLMIPGDRGRVFNESQLNQLGGPQPSGGAVTINLTVNALDPTSAATAVVQALQDWVHRNGPLPVEVSR